MKKSFKLIRSAFDITAKDYCAQQQITKRNKHIFKCITNSINHSFKISKERFSVKNANLFSNF